MRKTRPESAPRGEWTRRAALGGFAGAAMVANAVWREPAASGAGVLLILAGIPLYLLFRRRAAAGEGAG